MMPGWKKRWEERKPIIGHLKVLVYGIVNPLNNELFYIGVTQSPLRQRLSGHISGSVSKSLTKPSQRQLIIKSIIAVGLEPEIIEVDRVCLSEVCFWENFYIEYYKALGCNLCQLAKGPNYTISYGAIGGIYYM